MKVLVVEDDLDLLDVLSYALRREGYVVAGAVDGQQALHRFDTEKPDIVLLDINLPKVSGLEVCRRLRQNGSTPVIMVTGFGDEEQVLQGFGLGADDYVVKPFSPKQLIARMKAVLNRCERDPYRQAVTEVRVGDLVLNIESHVASRAGRVVQLTPLEFRILNMLTMNPGRVVPYSRLVDFAWGFDGGDSSLLKTHVCHIREKLQLTCGRGGGIRVVPSVGYALSID